MTTGVAFFSGTAPTVGASVSPGNGVIPLGTSFMLVFALSAFDDPNIRCHKLGFGAGSGTGISATGASSFAVSFGVEIIWGAGATCTICAGAVDVTWGKVEFADPVFGADEVRGDDTSRELAAKEFFSGSFGSTIVATSGGLDFITGTGAGRVAVTLGAGVCSKALAMAFTSSQFAGLGVSAR